MALNWDTDLAGWPNSSLSRRIRHRPHDWHVQIAGAGPVVLMLHGAGASTHSWRDILPDLAADHQVIALDLPGQGLTRAGTKRRCGLEAMGEDIASLCRTQGWRPTIIIGHSAGAALAFDLSTRLSDPHGEAPSIIGINAALGRFDGVAGWLFPVLAKLLALNPLTSAFFTLGGNPVARARRLIEGTGSVLDEEGIALYAKLISDRGHVDATLQMMAQWDVDPLQSSLPDIRSHCHLITGDNDLAVPPAVSQRAAQSLRHCKVTQLGNLGHMAHEEDPARILALLRKTMASADVGAKAP